MLIDAHQHFWHLAERQGYWPPPELAAIYRDFAPADLHSELAHCAITGTVLVQSLPNVTDTFYMLDLAAHTPHVLGVVGWVDLEASDAPAQIAQLAQHPKLKGLRPMLHDLPDTQWIANAALDPSVRAMQDHGLALDALVRPQHLGALLAFAQRHPGLPIVIDHAAKPEIALNRLEPWRSDMARLATLPQVHCKLSGLLTEAAPTQGADALAPYVDHLFACFGAQRLLWGSDWPVLNLAGHYTDWFAVARRLCAAQPGMSDTSMAAVFGGNARRFYHLN